MKNALPLEKIFQHILKNGGSYSDLYLENSETSTIVFDDDKIEKAISGQESGIGLRGIANLKTVYAHCNQTTEKEVLSVAGDLGDAIQRGKSSSRAFHYAPKASVRHDVGRPIPSVDVSKKVSVIRQANKAARAVDPRVVQVRVVYGDRRQRLFMANSLGESVEEERVYTLFTVHVVSREKGMIQTGYEPIGGLMGFDLFDENDPVAVAQTAAQRAIRNLEAKEAPVGVMPAVLSSEAGGTMIHEAVGHGLEADLALEGLSVYSNRLGELVASPLVTVVDDPTLANKRGSYGYDDEGTCAQRTVLIDNGVLRAFLCDRLYALKHDITSTGNGRRESYKHHPVVRMSNTIICPGNDDPAAIVANTPAGVFVKNMGGGQVNTVNGDFMFEVSEGYLINNGQISDPIRGATLTGNGPEVLKSIDRIGNDLGFGIGTCGKDGQGVPISDAQPTLRIPQIIVGGTANP